MTRYLFQNANILDAERGEYLPDSSVLVEGDRILEVGGAEVQANDVQSFDLRGMTLMPGLIDAHVHVVAVTADLAALSEWSPAYITARAARVLAGMLRRGFTTVRDVGGADYGLAQALEEGYLEGPRLIFCGKALSQTGGHGDFRSPGRQAYDLCHCGLARTVICDGVDEVRRAVREEIRRGASHIKLLLSGGVASPTDRVDSTQFSREEIRAAVEEAEAANLYVVGHAYTSRAINRGLECGVRSIEHGNLMDESSLALFQESGAFYVPTLVTYSALASRGREFGLPERSHRKVFEVLNAGLHALEAAHRAHIPLVYGTDLLGGMHEEQLHEFTLRREVQPPADILRSATTVAARLLRMEGQVGVVAPGASADLLVVDGDPLQDIAVLTDPQRRLKLVMARGRLCVNHMG
ncbi:MAG TPA: amidohydrolase family protein [Ktedonobacteraceae bacterium]|nr:amidohydrolase family protein [Ktedonobacteraceae bacterium]